MLCHNLLSHGTSKPIIPTFNNYDSNMLLRGNELSTITVRLDPEIKKKIRKYPHINWSEVAREAIIRKIQEQESRDVAEALLINEELRRKAPKGWDSAKVIRSWRRRR